MKKSVGVLLATAVLALSSACGGSTSGSGERETVIEKSDAAVVADRSPSDAPLTRDNFVERLGSAQRDAGSARLEMSTSASGMEVAMTGDVRVGEDISTSASRIVMDVGPMTMDVRLVEGVLYVKMGEMSGGKYVRIDLQDSDNPLVERFGTSIDQVDPSRQLETLDHALVDFDNEGDGGVVDGVETTKVRLVLDTKKMLGDHAAAVEQRGAELPKRVEYVVFVGRNDDLMRRMAVDVAGDVTTIDWSRWGEDVTVEAPEPSEVTEAPPFPFSAGVALDG